MVVDWTQAIFFKNIFKQWAQLYDLVTDTKMKTRGLMNAAARERATKCRKMLVIGSAEDSFFEACPGFIEKYIHCGWIDVLHGGAMETGPSSPSSGEPGLVQSRSTIIWNGLSYADLKSTLHQTLRRKLRFWRTEQFVNENEAPADWRSASLVGVLG